MPPVPPRSIILASMSSLPASRSSPSIGGHVLVAGLLDRDDVLDLAQLGEQVVGHVDRRPAGDVVGHDRQVGGGRDRLVVGLDAAPVGPHVVGRDDQHGVHADLGGALGQLDAVARVVGAGAGDHRASPLSATPISQRRTFSSSVSVARLAGAAGEHEAVRAVVEQVVDQPRGGVLVELPVASRTGSPSR